MGFVESMEQHLLNVLSSSIGLRDRCYQKVAAYANVPESDGKETFELGLRCIYRINVTSIKDATEGLSAAQQDISTIIKHFPILYAAASTRCCTS